MLFYRQENCNTSPLMGIVAVKYEFIRLHTKIIYEFYFKCLMRYVHKMNCLFENCKDIRAVA